MEENKEVQEENVKEKREPGLLVFTAVSRFKSVNRAIRRGHVSPLGFVYPKRPFNNKSNKNNSRPFNELKKQIYGQLKRRRQQAIAEA